MSMSTAQLVSFMSDGVAKRLGTAEFDGAVKILCNEHTMSTEQLVACMSDSVAATLRTAEVDDTLNTLCNEHGMSLAQLHDQWGS